jgi:hypothetical protein
MKRNSNLILLRLDDKNGKELSLPQLVKRPSIDEFQGSEESAREISSRKERRLYRALVAVVSLNVFAVSSAVAFYVLAARR